MKNLQLGQKKSTSIIGAIETVVPKRISIRNMPNTLCEDNCRDGLNLYQESARCHILQVERINVVNIHIEERVPGSPSSVWTSRKFLFQSSAILKELMGHFSLVQEDLNTAYSGGRPWHHPYVLLLFFVFCFVIVFGILACIMQKLWGHGDFHSDFTRKP